MRNASITSPSPPSEYDAARRQPTIQSQALRYAFLSAVSFAGNLTLIAGLHEWGGLSTYLAVPIALVCMTLFNFFTIRMMVFTDSNRGLLQQFIGFISSIAGFRAAEYAGFILLHGVFAAPYLPAAAAILAVSAACKFLFLRRVVFAGPRNPAPLAEVTS